jgi:putative ABC transport system permease protein
VIVRTFLSRLLDIVLHRPREQRLSEEVQSHLDLLADDFMAKGMSRDEATLAARRAFGGVDQAKERYRDHRGFLMITELVQDTRHAFRLMARERWFTAATVLALSLGIGATTTMVTILYSMNIRGLPFNEAASLVGVTGERTRSQGPGIPLTIFEHWRSASRSFEVLSAEIDSPINLGDETRGTDQFAGTYLSFNAFALLRERPLLGREFLPEDDRTGAAPVAIVGYRVWTERYGSDPLIVGRTVRLNGEAATIIGVMPEGFAYPVDTQVWRPLASFPGIQQAAQRPIRVVGRLARGISTEQAQSELAAILSTLTAVPDADRTRRTIVIPLNETYFGTLFQPVPMMLTAAVVIVLLIACSHAASLLLARSATRSRELSMRSALGAGRARLVRQLLVESVLMALLAGVIGVAIAAGFVRAFAGEMSLAGLPYWTRFSFDPALAAIITGLCIATGITFGVLPALQQSRTSLNEVLNQFGRSGMVSPRSRRWSTIMLVGELAITVILLSAASAFVRSANVVYQADAAVDLDNLWEFRLALPPIKYPAGEAQQTFFTALEERVAAAPGLQSAALASQPPFNSRDSRGVVMDGTPLPDGSSAPQTHVVAIGPRYFETLGLPLVRGSRIEDVDAASRSAVALVNERFAARFSPDADPIGRDVVLINERVPSAPQRRFRIVGIAPPLRQQQQNSHTPAVYIPFLAEPGANASLIVRGNPQQFAAVVREEVRRLDPDLPVFNLRSLALVSYMSRFTHRITSTVFSIVAVIAIALSALGLYSLTAYATTQRTHEVGVRMALGAQRSQVAWLFLKQTLAQVSVGLVIGMIGAVAAGFALQGVFVDVTANQPIVLAAIAGFVTLVALVAAVLPARRAARLDPVAALRQE